MLLHPSTSPTLFRLFQVFRSSVIHHPTALVYSLIIISFSLSVSNPILSEVLKTLLGLCCTNSLERTPKETFVSLIIYLPRLLILTSSRSPVFCASLSRQAITYPDSTLAPLHNLYHNQFPPQLHAVSSASPLRIRT